MKIMLKDHYSRKLEKGSSTSQQNLTIQNYIIQLENLREKNSKFKVRKQLPYFLSNQKSIKIWRKNHTFPLKRKVKGVIKIGSKVNLPRINFNEFMNRCKKATQNKFKWKNTLESSKNLIIKQTLRNKIRKLVKKPNKKKPLPNKIIDNLNI